MLAAGQCDLVAVVRGQIADPEFAAKARDRKAGRDPAACLSCNQESRGAGGPQPLARLHR